MKAKWKVVVEDFSLDMSGSALKSVVDTLSSYGLPLFHRDAASLVLTRAAKARRDADKVKLVGLVDALRKPRSGGALPLVKPSTMWSAIQRSLQMLQKKEDTLATTEASLVKIIHAFITDADFPLVEDAVVEAEEEDELFPMAAWAAGKGLLGAAGSGGGDGADQVSAHTAVHNVLSSGKKGAALADVAVEALKVFPREQAASAAVTAVLKVCIACQMFVKPVIKTQHAEQTLAFKRDATNVPMGLMAYSRFSA